MSHSRDKRGRELEGSEGDLATQAENQPLNATVAIPPSILANIIPNIAQHFSPKKAKVFTMVSQSFKNGFFHQDLSKGRFMSHFPHLVDQFDRGSASNWPAAFVEATRVQYGDNKRLADLFYLTKQGNLEELREMKITYEDLVQCDQTGIPLSSWARSLPSQSVRDHFYRVVVAHYYSIARSVSIGSGHRDADGNSLLHWAVLFTQQLDLIKHMVNHQYFEIDCLNSASVTPLLLSIHADTGQYTACLLALKADVERRDARDLTPLAYAIHENAPDAVRALLNHGADIHATFQVLEHSALTYAAALGSLACLKVLLEASYKGKVNIVAIDRTPLFIAAMNGHIDCVKLLLAHQADPFILTDLDESPVFIAAKHGYVDIVRLIITHDSQRANQLVNKCTLLGESPLLAATVTGKQEYEACAEFLISCGAKVDLLLADLGATALMLAAQESDVAGMALLLKLGADVNCVSSGDQSTALHLAAMVGNLEGIALLLEAGADQALEATVTSASIMNSLTPDTPPVKRAEVLRFVQSFPDQNKIQLTAEQCAEVMQQKAAQLVLQQHQARLALPAYTPRKLKF
tara:strand:+ start:198 stop:1928 length:1731 start_codon:yes stop_codon:yes gene_type:complete